MRKKAQEKRIKAMQGKDEPIDVKKMMTGVRFLNAK